MDIDSLLDSTLDDLSDIPEFKPFPIGAHRCTIKWGYAKKINDKPVIELSLTAIETVELTNPEEDKPLEAGTSTNVIFQLVKKDGTKNELGEGQLKEALAPLQAHFGTASNRATMDASNGAECLIVTTIRKDKNDATKAYTGIGNLQVL